MKDMKEMRVKSYLSITVPARSEYTCSLSFISPVPDGHGGGVLPGGAKRGGHPGGHPQSVGGNNPHGKGFIFRKVRQRVLDSEKGFAVLKVAFR
jgi:hypothetical protein